MAPETLETICQDTRTGYNVILKKTISAIFFIMLKL